MFNLLAHAGLSGDRLQRTFQPRHHFARSFPAAGLVHKARIAAQLRLAALGVMEAQIGSGLCHQGVERGIAGEAEDVIGAVILRPFHGLDAAVMAVAAPDDAGPAPMSPQTLRYVLDDRPHLRALRGAGRAQQRHHRRAAPGVIDVHRGEAALVVMGVPECQLLAAMRGAERVVDIQDRLPARLHGGGELVEESRGEPCRFDLARRVFQAADGRLRGQCRTTLRTAADRKFHQRVVPQPVKVDRIFMPARNRSGPRHHHLEHRVPYPVGIAAIRHRFRQPPAYPKPALRLPQQQQAGIGGLIAATKIDRDFLAANGGQVKREQRIERFVSHGGCGAELKRRATERNTRFAT